MSDRQDFYNSTPRDKLNAAMAAMNNFLHTMNHGFMTVNCGPGFDPFISIKFVNLERAHAAHRALIALAMVARTATDTKPPQEHVKAPQVPLDDLYKVATDQAKQIEAAGGEIGSLRLALMSMMDHEEPETLRGMAARILDRSQERWPPPHRPHHSLAAVLEKPSLGMKSLRSESSFSAETSEDKNGRLTAALEQAIDHLVRLDAHVDGQGYRPSIRGTVALGRSALSSQTRGTP